MLLPHATRHSILATALSMACLTDARGETRRPNILIILTDDNGYADLGSYGGEIDTPSLDRLARNGMRFSAHYSNGRCSPTRASLLTGHDCARVGFAAGTLGGWQRELPLDAYRARLPFDIPTLPELLRKAGYGTFMSGKWHLGGSVMEDRPALQEHWRRTHPGWELTPDEIKADFNALPMQRGFDRFFGLIEGETHFFLVAHEAAPGVPNASLRGHSYWEGNDRARLEPSGVFTLHCYYEEENRYPFHPGHGQTLPAWHATIGVTDKAIEMIRDHRSGGDDPFFLYLAYQAPHIPLQAPEELVQKYLPRYADLAAVEQGRVDGLIREGLFPADAPWQRRYSHPGFRFPDEETKAGFQRRLAIHAAMTEQMDEQIGRLITVMEETGDLDNTLILYTSDNGAATHVGNLMNKPYQGAKALLWEGGVRTHLIAHWPGRIPAGAVNHTTAWVGDFLSTALEVAGIEYPEQFRGRDQEPPAGRSLVPALTGVQMDPPEALFFNDRGQQSVIYQGRWKLLIEPGWYVHTSREPGIAYELYDLLNDPAETINLAGKHPERVDYLEELCRSWQERMRIRDRAEILKMRP